MNVSVLYDKSSSTVARTRFSSNSNIYPIHLRCLFKGTEKRREKEEIMKYDPEVLEMCCAA